MIAALGEFAGHPDAQALVATHSPSMLKRVPPESVRYLRLDAQRQTSVRAITLPPNTDKAYKYVREAVQAYPELYFSRLVVLGEGASEEIVLPRALGAKGLPADAVAVSITPLGGRHVNHFWRLLNDLAIPHLTLLDLDRGRHQGGWGRVRYALAELLKIQADAELQAKLDSLPKWDSDDDVMATAVGTGWRDWLRGCGVHFSSPLDLDFAMLEKFPAAFGVEATELKDPDEKTIKAVLGESDTHADHYGASARLFAAYRKLFKDGSKPVNHLQALAALSDAQLVANLPIQLAELVDAVQAKLKAIPE